MREMMRAGRDPPVKRRDWINGSIKAPLATPLKTRFDASATRDGASLFSTKAVVGCP